MISTALLPPILIHSFEMFFTAVGVVYCFLFTTILVLRRIDKKKTIEKPVVTDESWDDKEDSKYLMYFLTKLPVPQPPGIDLTVPQQQQDANQKIIDDYLKKKPLTTKAPDMSKYDPSLTGSRGGWDADPFNYEALYTRADNLDQAAFERATVEKPIPTPKSIKKHLDDYVIGQEVAKKAISVAVSTHYRRVQFNHILPVPIKKGNILMIGPTGSGKTLLASSMARELGVPFVTIDISAFTASGYVGRNVEEIVDDLISASKSRDEAMKGIVFIDEVDKITSKTGENSGSQHTNGRRVQQELLKLLEGSTVKRFDTKNVLFILGGAFEGLSDIVQERSHKTSIGFTSNVTKDKSDIIVSEHLTTKDLVDFGFIPEFLGRIPIVVTLEKLSESDLIRVLSEPKDSILREYEGLLSTHKCDLVFTIGAIKEVAKQASAAGTGARGLRSIISKVMMDVLYELPENPLVKQIKITKKMVEDKYK